MTRMQPKRPNLVHRLAVGGLLAVLGVGLWQGYGEWIVRLVRAHVA
jgi:hypothetical protein